MKKIENVMHSSFLEENNTQRPNERRHGAQDFSISFQAHIELI